jgi:hypothetical protein
MVYTDGTHLVSDKNEDELHAFAQNIGLKREWFQNNKRPHYDLTTRRMSEKAIRFGAKMVTAKDIIVITRGISNANKN